MKFQLDPQSLLIQLSYHGFAYHGWVMQKDLPSIELVFRSTWEKLFHYPIRAFTASRTDAHVHALDQWIKVMAKVDIQFDEEKMQLLNLHLPQDIRVLSFKTVEKGYNIIGAAQSKQYCYLVANHLPDNLEKASEKILHFIEELNLDLMNQAAACFVGRHSFYNFQRRENSTAQFYREVLSSQVTQITHWENIELSQPVYCYSVISKGFLRQMVRIMMGAILNVGHGRISIEELKLALQGDTKTHVGFVSPGYGLYLKKIHF